MSFFKAYNRTGIVREAVFRTSDIPNGVNVTKLSNDKYEILFTEEFNINTNRLMVREINFYLFYFTHGF